MVCSHYVSSYCDHYHPTCDCCVLWSIADRYDHYASSHLCGLGNMRSAWYGSAITVDIKGHNEEFCWSPNYATAITTSSLGCLLRCMQTMPWVLHK